MRKILLIAILLLIFICHAREPKVGDLVNVIAGDTDYTGKITGMSNGMMCLDARVMKHVDKWICDEYCFGIGQIQSLHWINESEET